MAKLNLYSIDNYNGYIYAFHDSIDSSVDVIHTYNLEDSLISLGKNHEAHISTEDSAVRYTHGTYISQSDIELTSTFYKNKIFTENNIEINYPIDTFQVTGYIVTDSFQLWIEDGNVGACELRYNLSTMTYEIDTIMEVIDSLTIIQGEYSFIGHTYHDTTIVLE